MRERYGRYSRNPRLIQQENTLETCGIYETRKGDFNGDNLALFIWDNVLCDYSCGLFAVLAHNKEDAIEILESAFEGDDYLKEEFDKVKNSEPIVLKNPSAIWTSGGS